MGVSLTVERLWSRDHMRAEGGLEELEKETRSYVLGCGNWCEGTLEPFASRWAGYEQPW